MDTASAGNNVSKKRPNFCTEKSPSPDDFGETFACNLIKQNVTHFPFIFLTQNFLLCPWKT